MQTSLILVGGFLGAGKTTLVAQAAARLARRGRRVGLITNDQAANLVDTAILSETAEAVQEVAGGCFCCRFGDLVEAMDRLVRTSMPDVLIGEPVGSCTDLSATVLQPIKKLHADRFRVAPFSVLVDGKQVRTLQRLRKSLSAAQSPRFPDSVMYIYEKQLEEADLIVLNKADLMSPEELAEIEQTLAREFTQAPVLTVSAREGMGVDAWLDRVLADGAAGRSLLDVDYDRYAAGEAALGWLNAAIRLSAACPTDWAAWALELVRAMQARFRQADAEVAHMKAHLTAGSESVVVNLTSNDGQPLLRGAVKGTSSAARMLLNVRAKIDPAPLREIAEQCVAAAAVAGVSATIEVLESFSPARPQPTHRFPSVV